MVKTCGRPSISRISTIIQTLRLAGVEEAPVIGLGGDQLPEEEEEGDGGEEGEQGGLQQVHAHVVVDKNQPVIAIVIIVREGQRWYIFGLVMVGWWMLTLTLSFYKNQPTIIVIVGIDIVIEGQVVVSS